MFLRLHKWKFSRLSVEIKWLFRIRAEGGEHNVSGSRAHQCRWVQEARGASGLHTRRTNRGDSWTDSSVATGYFPQTVRGPFTAQKVSTHSIYCFLLLKIHKVGVSFKDKIVKIIYTSQSQWWLGGQLRSRAHTYQGIWRVRYIPSKVEGSSPGKKFKNFLQFHEF